MDIEFAYDNAVYLQGELENLQKLESGFCKRSNAMINWHKSCAIWLSHEAHPTWHPNLTFKWINQGASTKYLGFQIGFNIPPETMIALVIHSIRQKLIHWSSKKLSLAGHIIVANSQQHGTTYHVGQSPRKIYTRFSDWYANIWSGKEDHAARAKVV